MYQRIIVIKIGSNVIFGNSARIDLSVLGQIAGEIRELRAAGWWIWSGAGYFLTLAPLKGKIKAESVFLMPYEIPQRLYKQNNSW